MLMDDAVCGKWKNFVEGTNARAGRGWGGGKTYLTK